MDDSDRRWKLIKEHVERQARGDEAPRFSSKRTLFGIKSDVEEKMEAVVREMEERSRR